MSSNVGSTNFEKAVIGFVALYGAAMGYVLALLIGVPALTLIFPVIGAFLGALGMCLMLLQKASPSPYLNEEGTLSGACPPEVWNGIADLIRQYPDQGQYISDMLMFTIASGCKPLTMDYVDSSRFECERNHEDQVTMARMMNA
jgi:hypothetical protein